MADHTWPTNLPDWRLPTTDKADKGFLRTQMDAGPSKVRRRYSAVPTRFQTSIIVDGTQRYILDEFYHKTLGEGALKFDRTDPVRGGDQEFRFLDTPDYEQIKGAELSSERAYRVQLVIERMPAQKVPEYTVLLDGNYANDLITFSRSSKGWYWGADGLLKEAAADEMRFDHDPESGQLLGLLIEEERERLNTIAEAPTAAEDVTVSAVEHTISFYGSGSIDLSGAYSDTLNGTGALPERVTLTFTPSAGTLTITPSGDVQHLQLEEGGVATSPILGEGSAVTRSADDATVTDLSWYNQSEGTFVIDFNVSRLPDNPKGLIDVLKDGAGNDFEKPMIFYSGDDIHVRFTDGPNNNIHVNQINILSVGKHRLAASYADGSLASAFDGGNLTVNTGSFILTDQADTMLIGHLYNENYLNDHIRSLHYYPNRLANAKLQSLTS